MKRIFLMVILVLFMFTLPMSANADVIGNVTIDVDSSGPTGYVTIDGKLHNLYLDYDVSINGKPNSEAFCVENANAYVASEEPQLYTLLTIDTSLSNFGFPSDDRYLMAAKVAEYFSNNYSTNDAYKAGAQMLIWELVWDGIQFDLATGNFKASSTNNNYTDEAFAIWSTINKEIPTSGSPWALAVNPTVEENETVNVEEYQNYLVRVPEPSTLMLLCVGLIGLAGSRKKV